MPRAIPVGALVVYHDNRPPSTSDDSATIRARRGYWWVDALAGDFWLCVDPAEGAAVWYRLGNAEDLAAIALSGSWNDLGDTPTTLTGYGITDAVPDSRVITAGTGLEGGGDLSGDRSFSLAQTVLDSLGLADTAVQPGDLAAIATSGDWADISGTPTTLAGYGITDAALASDLASHENNTSNPHGVTASQVGAPPTSRTITAGTGLTGGGDLSANRTISLSTATQNSLALADTAVQPGDLAAIATSGAWDDLANTPTTLSGYGITDALARASNLADLNDAATARSNLGLGSAAVEDASAFDASGSAASAESNAKTYADGKAAPVSLTPMTAAGTTTLTASDLGKLILSAGYDITLPSSSASGMHNGWRCRIRNTHGQALSGWGFLGRSLSIHCAGNDLIDGEESLTLPAGGAVEIVRHASGHFIAL